ncbi:peptide ABC transporter ATPase [Microbacterium sp. JC 701]|uniref:WcbI family polysaccharide biosynthesis putative acetyltransferase n=1 Tax=Microbacterium sp. JC 701 TaxID=2897389 RepID=UPI001E34EE4A|nr:WcbI family polysaccharide biosynthesis putative acetyltransferase [Microbacterium sp. JC 701]MCD2170861.1 peptide ABC transporter ATPase [Microbacterium sp. JC 701]
MAPTDTFLIMGGERPGLHSLADHGDAVIARRAHYAAFFGDAAPPAGFGLVVGNCQAESLRLVISSDGLPAIRVPAVHELGAADAERLHALLAEAAFLVVQPIRDDYRGLPLGTAQLRAALPSGARTVTVPAVRFAGLHPFQAVLRLPDFPEDPPIVAYHDVRTVAAAAGIAVPPRLPARTVREIADASIAELRRREAMGLDVSASDLFSPVVSDLARTVNHPGNALFLPLGERIVAALGRPGRVVDPGRPILASVRAPLESWVVDAWDLDDAPEPDWIVAGERVSAEAVRDAQSAYYAAHPALLAAVVERMTPLLRTWAAAA